MTFTEIVSNVAGRLGIESAASLTRIGTEVNGHYKRLTSSLGIQVARQVVGVIGTTSMGIQTLEFTGLEKVDRVIDDRSGSNLELTQRSLKEIRATAPVAGDPTEYAILNMGPGSVTILLNSLPQSAFDVKADGLETAETLAGSQVPQFPASFHDILVERVVADEQRDREKLTLATRADQIADRRESQLRLFIAKHGPKIQQGLSSGSTSGGTTGGGGGISGGTSWTQTGLITFMRGLLAPFAVQAGSAKVENLDADTVDGQHAADIVADAVAASGDVDGPGSSVDNAVARFHLTTGKVIQNSGATIDDSGNLTANNVSGTTSGTNTGDVTLGGSPNYLTIVGQVITRALIDLASHITGRLPYANLVASTAASKIVGRQSGSAGDWQEITLGTGLTMSGTTLNGASTTKPFVAFTAASNRPPAASYATVDTRNDNLVLDFDAGADEHAVFAGVLPVAYAGGGLTVEIRFAMTSATSGNVGWLAAIERLQSGTDTIASDSFASAQSVSQAVPGTAGILTTATITFTNGAQMDSLAAGESFRLKITRDGDGSVVTDSATGDAELWSVTVRET